LDIAARDFAVPGGEGSDACRPALRRTFWDKMNLAKDIEHPFLDWDKVKKVNQNPVG
jgi:hypothetical protein